jgi:hypothetical protein
MWVSRVVDICGSVHLFSERAVVIEPHSAAIPSWWRVKPIRAGDNYDADYGGQARRRESDALGRVRIVIEDSQNLLTKLWLLVTGVGMAADALISRI